MSCAACGGQTQPWLRAPGFEPADHATYELARCEDCGTAMTIGSEPSPAAYSSGIYAEGSPRLARIIGALQRLAMRLPGKVLARGERPRRRTSPRRRRRHGTARRPPARARLSRRGHRPVAARRSGHARDDRRAHGARSRRGRHVALARARLRSGRRDRPRARDAGSGRRTRRGRAEPRVAAGAAGRAQLVPPRPATPPHALHISAAFAR